MSGQESSSSVLSQSEREALMDFFSGVRETKLISSEMANAYEQVIIAHNYWKKAYSLLSENVHRKRESRACFKENQALQMEDILICMKNTPDQGSDEWEKAVRKEAFQAVKQNNPDRIPGTTWTQQVIADLRKRLNSNVIEK